MDFTFAIALLVLSFVVQAIASPRANKPKPALMQEFDFPQTDEGTPQCVYFGDCWTEDWIVLWYGKFRTTAIKTK